MDLAVTKPSSEIVRRARELRKTATSAEALLWEFVRDRRLAGFKFRRQHPVGRFVADFYCAELSLIIELDGGVHDDPDQVERDRCRTEILNANHYHLLRFSNSQILDHPETVLETLTEFATT